MAGKGKGFLNLNRFKSGKAIKRWTKRQPGSTPRQRKPLGHRQPV